MKLLGYFYTGAAPLVLAAPFCRFNSAFWELLTPPPLAAKEKVKTACVAVLPKRFGIAANAFQFAWGGFTSGVYSAPKNKDAASRTLDRKTQLRVKHASETRSHLQFQV